MSHLFGIFFAFLFLFFPPFSFLFKPTKVTNGAFTLDIKSLLNENLGGILGGTQC